ncbi:hypothetical protein CH63R_04990 [Colletotrichum higginsianum IMI 349063]|uniref:Uncharacterized protein n=1 Tax=Colletotrichum higginsianum (strain IMI 349063) TaxID=759273 RepID=A0A1B7YL62_COLHI|nr:hypothetical protein CH63R_04990 [Colletotrichum higginsianum IMI 349063]OBR12694.1 hypothetical protein CH63R_04990 [Colletotrichum higginsianum IMI 349063]
MPVSEQLVNRRQNSRTHKRLISHLWADWSTSATSATAAAAGLWKVVREVERVDDLTLFLRRWLTPELTLHSERGPPPFCLPSLIPRRRGRSATPSIASNVVL